MPTVPPPPAAPSVAFSFVIVVIIVASAVIVSALIYILLRFLSRRFHRSFRTFATATDDVVSPGRRPQCHDVPPAAFLDSLPLFTIGSVTGTLTGGDCAVCLSKFEQRDQLRLLPFCCHAFHAACVDTWIVANQTCPLCRSTVIPSDAEVLDKTAAAERNLPGSGSFRVEIGNVSRRRDGGTDGERRSYSIGSFEYILDDNGHEVLVEKESVAGIPASEEAEASGRRNWLKDYVDRLATSSMSSSFRSSGRFFSGSSRRSEVVFAVEDVEANRVGEEISEMFGWLSGV